MAKPKQIKSVYHQNKAPNNDKALSGEFWQRYDPMHIPPDHSPHS